MDRTGWIGVTTCAVLLVLWYTLVLPKTLPKPTPGGVKAPVATAPADAKAPETFVGTANKPADPGKTFDLATSRATFTIASRGGGISTASLKDFKRTMGSEAPLVLNEPNRGTGLTLPIGTLGLGSGAFEDTVYQAEEKADGIVLTGTLGNGLKVVKRFATLPRPEDKAGQPNDPTGHLVSFQLRLENTGKEPLPVGRYSVYGGAMATTHTRGQMDTGFFWKQGNFVFKRVDWLKGFLFRPDRESYESEAKHLDWAGVKSEYFTLITRPLEHRPGKIWARRFATTIEGEEEQSIKMQTKGIECALGLPPDTLAPGETRVFDYEIYMGPKKFALISQLPDGQRAAMGYDKVPMMETLFGWIIKPLAQLFVTLLTTFNGWFGNYGVAVLLLTVVVRAIMWPLHAKAHATSKQMAQLTPMLNELRAKYEDDPQKMQQEQMKLWAEYGINPMGGCLPALVQMPIFIAYFRMLSSAVELRHEPFVAWIKDLSMPDTITSIGGFDINLLPVLMAATSYVQFAMMPKTGDKNQRMIFMMFPLMFLYFCYTYASALALYWTWSNLISIFQTYVLNKRPIPPLQKLRKRKSSWIERLHQQAEAAQRAQAANRTATASGPGTGTSSNFGERGPRNQKPKAPRRPKGKRR